MARKTRKATEAERAQYEAGTKPFYDIINSFPWGTLNEETLAARKGLKTSESAPGSTRATTVCASGSHE